MFPYIAPYVLQEPESQELKVVVEEGQSDLEAKAVKMGLKV